MYNLVETVEVGDEGEEKVYTEWVDVSGACRPEYDGTTLVHYAESVALSRARKWLGDFHGCSLSLVSTTELWAPALADVASRTSDATSVTVFSGRTCSSHDAIATSLEAVRKDLTVVYVLGVEEESYQVAFYAKRGGTVHLRSLVTTEDVTTKFGAAKLDSSASLVLQHLRHGLGFGLCDALGDLEATDVQIAVDGFTAKFPWANSLPWLYPGCRNLSASRVLSTAFPGCLSELKGERPDTGPAGARGGGRGASGTAVASGTGTALSARQGVESVEPPPDGPAFFNYLIVLRGVTAGKLQEAIPRDDPHKTLPMGAQAFKDLCSDLVERGLGEVEVISFNSGMSSRWKRPEEHVNGSSHGNALPQYVAEVYRAADPDSVTVEKCVYYVPPTSSVRSQGHAFLMESVLGSLFMVQGDAARKMVPLDLWGHLGFALASLNFQSPGEPQGDPWLRCGILARGPKQRHFVKDLIADSSTAVAGLMMRDQLVGRCKMQPSAASMMTAAEAWSKMCSAAGELHFPSSAACCPPRSAAQQSLFLPFTVARRWHAAWFGLICSQLVHNGRVSPLHVSECAEARGCGGPDFKWNAVSDHGNGASLLAPVRSPARWRLHAPPLFLFSVIVPASPIVGTMVCRSAGY